MKKITFVLFFILFVALGVSVSHVSAQAAACPSGYVCTSSTNHPQQPSSPTCPTGYTCARVTPPTVVVIGQPTLTLTYDSLQKESALTALFANIQVTAGNYDLKIYKSSGTVTFTRINLSEYPKANPNAASVSIFPIGTVNQITDSYGNSLFVIPANTKASFRISGSIFPQTNFPGTYIASLKNISSSCEPGSAEGAWCNVDVKANITNSKTVIGETSPYIISVTNPVMSGQKMLIQGRRLNGALIFLDSVPGDYSVIGATNGTSLSFAFPSYLSAGVHTLYVKNDTTGSSNTIQFQVTDSNLPSLTLSTPDISSIPDTNGNVAVTIPQGSTFSISGAPKNVSGFTMAWFFDPIFNSSCTNNDPQKNSVWTLTCTAKIVGPGKIYARIYQNGQTYFSNVITVTVKAVPTSGNRPPSIGSLTAPTQLAVNQVGTWILSASDPENGPLSYSVSWGGTDMFEASSKTPSVAFTQDITLTHSYSSPGTYSVAFQIKDNAEQTVRTSATVQVVNGTPVTPPPTNPSVPVSTPATTTTPISTTPVLVPTPSTPVFCYTFTEPLKFGSGGAAVTALDTILKKEGFISTVNSQYGTAEGAAVLKFQVKYALPVGGAVDTATMKYLNKLYGCTVSSAVSSKPTQTATVFESIYNLITPVFSGYTR